MTHRERLLNVLNYQPVDRGVYGVWIWQWPETRQRWVEEGYDPGREPYFDVDSWAWQGGWFHPHPPFEREVVEEDEATIVYVNADGVLVRERKDNPMSSMPQFVRFPAETREDFRHYWRERMQPDLAGRIGDDYAARLSSYRNRDVPLIVHAGRYGGFFGGPRNFVGVERLCTLFYDEPPFVEEMMDATADFLIAVMDRILEHTSVDVFGFWEDRAYTAGPMSGPSLVRRFMLPRYRRVVDHLRSRGVEWFCLDSDGDISSLIPIWLDAGINILYAFEAQAGMDVVQVRKEFGRDLRMWFGIDKRALVEGPAAIDAELARVRPLVEEGGYVAGLDHGIPPDVSFANYCYYLEHLREMVGLSA